MVYVAMYQKAHTCIHMWYTLHSVQKEVCWSLWPSVTARVSTVVPPTATPDFENEKRKLDCFKIYLKINSRVGRLEVSLQQWPVNVWSAVCRDENTHSLEWNEAQNIQDAGILC